MRIDLVTFMSDTWIVSLPPADFELAQLQEKLRETELVMEKIVSKAHHSPDRSIIFSTFLSCLILSDVVGVFVCSVSCAIQSQLN